MPSEKTARSSEKKRVRNRGIRTSTRTMAARAIRAVQAGELDEVEPAVAQAVRTFDKAVTSGILHANNAARKKSRLMAKLNSLKAS